MTTVCVVLFTYSPTVDGPRAQYADETLRHVIENLETIHQLSIHIADDGSPQEHRDRLFQLAGGYRQVGGVSVSNSERGGYGASYNAATQVTRKFADVTLALEDDWRLSGPLDIDPYVEALTEHDIRCIRLGRLGYTDELRGTFRAIGGRHYVILDPESPEKHVFVGGPRLESPVYQRAIGRWPEGLRAGETELAVCARPGSRIGVALPWTQGPFHHIGAVQTQELTG